MTLRYDCSTFDRSQVADHYKTDTRLRDYIDERKEDTETKEEKVPIPRSLQGAVLLFFERERERGEGEVLFPAANGTGGGEMGGEKMVERWKVLLRASW